MEGQRQEFGRLARVLKATLSGEVQVVDGMDTLCSVSPANS